MTQAAEKQEELHPIPPSLWKALAGCSVLVQLKPGVLRYSCTYPNTPVLKVTEVDGKGEPIRQGFVTGKQAQAMAVEAQQEQQRAQAALAPGEKLPPEQQRQILTEPAAQDVLMGRLSVLQDAERTMLLIEYQDPLDEPSGGQKGAVRVVIDPELVGFVSTVTRSLIQI
jgi:hypothetical protein